MASSHDITITCGGTKYGFTLAIVDSRKAWSHKRMRVAPPSIVKEIIEAVLTARERDLPLSAAEQYKRVNKIITDLDTIAAATTASTMTTSWDSTSRSILIGADGYEVMQVVDEPDRDPEFQVKVTIWSLYS